MTFLPIVERELRVAARLPATYRNRALTAGVVAAVAVVMLMFGGATRSRLFTGAIAFRVLSYLTLVFCLMEGARKTADCVSEEKREGTLGLLFLTDLKGYDVVLGKLVANSLNSIYGLLAILPVLALPLLMGGVTQGEYWRMALVLLNLLFFSLCTGMFVSTVSRGEQRVAGNTVLLVAALTVLPLLQLMPLLSPVHAFLAAFDTAYAGRSRGYWGSLGFTQIWSWLLLTGACLIVPHSWQEKTTLVVAPSARPVRTAGERARLREKMLADNPIYWLAGRDRGQQFGLFCFGAVAVLGAVCFVAVSHIIRTPTLVPFYLGGCWVLNLMLKMRVAAQACHCHAEARRNNSLEMLLVTPLMADQIISGQLQALWRINIKPVFWIVCIEIVGLIVGAVATGSWDSWIGDTAPTAMLVGAGYLAVFALDLAAVTWAGMWFGLSAKKESQAVTKTILYVLIAPLFSVVLMCFGVIFLIGCPIFWIAWAVSRLNIRYRELAGQRYGLQPEKMGWAPIIVSPRATTPPVLAGRTDDGGGS